MVAGEKGIARRRLRVRHARPRLPPVPFGQCGGEGGGGGERIAEYNPSPSFHEYWRPQVDAMALDPELRAVLLDEGAIDEALRPCRPRPRSGTGTPVPTPRSRRTWSPARPRRTSSPMSSTSMSTSAPCPGRPMRMSKNTCHAGDIYDQVSVEVILEEPSTQSQIDTPLWTRCRGRSPTPSPPAGSPRRSVSASPTPVHRDLGAVAYGAGLLSPTLTPAEFGSRFHGHNERIISNRSI